MTIIVAPDKFKGSLTSFDACDAIKNGILQADSSVDVLLFPMADGGDGFASVMKYYVHTNTHYCESVDPLGRKIQSSYEWNDNTKVAIVEVASCSGLSLLKKHERNPLKTSSYGTGVQLQHAIAQGAAKIILGLGGSATNDAGMGILAALGFQMLNAAGKSIEPTGENLLNIQKIVPPRQIPAVHIDIACDVNNPLHGLQGAAYVFSPQKGADSEQVKMLDAGLKHIAEVLKDHSGKDVSAIPGTGAAGGIAAGLMSCFPVTMTEGTQLIINASGIGQHIERANMIITGEGKIDEQSERGKIVSAIVSLAKQKNVPVIGLCGKLELDASALKRLGLSHAWQINDGSLSEDYYMANAAPMLRDLARSIMPSLREWSGA